MLHLYENAADVLQEIALVRADGTEPRLIDPLASADLLIPDDSSLAP